jgi:hypothetical protein
MRTTVRLPDELLRRAKAAAAKEGTTLTELIDRGLRIVLKKPAKLERTYPPVSPQVGRQLVDVTKTSELLELLDEDLPLEKRR